MRILEILLVGLLLGGFLGNGEGFAAAASHATRTDSGGGVTVKVTYLDSKTTDDLRFQIALDTHSVNLDGYDLKTIPVLRDDAGKSYLPVRVENKGSGHHRQTTVIFPKLSGEVKSLELVIKDVAGIKKRTFRWDLN